MDLVFATKTIRHLCESQSKARRFFGKRVADKLRSRLSDLEAALNINDMSVWCLSEPPTEPNGQLSLEIEDGFALVIAAAETPTSNVEGVAIDWTRVTRVKVVKIEKS